MRRSDTKVLSLILLLCFALVSGASNAAEMITMQISGRVVIEGTGEPLANYEVELRTLELPWIPIGMGSYVKKATFRTDANGEFSFSAEVPKNRPFELWTRNPGTVFGGGWVNMDPASVIKDVTIVHKPSASAKQEPHR
jgi:hypothetical protein